MLATLLFSACETYVDPVIDTDIPYTMYGFFNPTSDTQAVRIYPVDGILERGDASPLDAVVTAINLSNGLQVAWRDSVVTYRDGEIGHVYWGRMSVAYEGRYRLEVRRSDGVVTAVEADVPPLTEGQPDDGNLSRPTLPINVLWPDAPNLIDISVVYETSNGNYEVLYGQEQIETSEGRVVVVNFRQDAANIIQDGAFLGFQRAILYRMRMSLVVTNSEWTPPGGVFDPEVLVERGVFSNVDNGYGFVGGGYRAEVEWVPSDTLMTRAGFRVE